MLEYMVTTAMLLASGLSHSFWEDAMKWALCIYNRVAPTRKPTNGEKWQSPQEASYKTGPPKMKNLLPFGSRVIAFIPKELRGLKGFAEIGTECILVGMHEQMIHTYICYKSSTNTYFTSV